MTVGGALAEASVAYARHAWLDAYTLLSRADGREPLAAEDLNRLATAAHLIGDSHAAGVAWERAYRAFVEHDQIAQAVRCSFWHALTLIQRGEHARGGGWLARGQSLLEQAEPDCAERGYLRLPVALQALDTAAPLPMRLMSILPVGRRLLTLQPASVRQVEHVFDMAARTSAGSPRSAMCCWRASTCPSTAPAWCR